MQDILTADDVVVLRENTAAEWVLKRSSTVRRDAGQKALLVAVGRAEWRVTYRPTGGDTVEHYLGPDIDAAVEAYNTIDDRV